MLQDRAHTSPRLSGSHRKVWTFFLFSTPLSCAEQSVGRGKKRQSAHDDGQLLYLDTKRGSPSTHHHSMLLLCPPGNTRKAGPWPVALWGGSPRGCTARVTGTSLADQWSPPSRAPVGRTVSTDNGSRSPLPPMLRRRLPLHVIPPAFCTSPDAKPLLAIRQEAAHGMIDTAGDGNVER